MGVKSEGPSQAEREFAAKFGFSLPPFGDGPPESFLLEVIDVFHKTNDKHLRHGDEGAA